MSRTAFGLAIAAGLVVRLVTLPWPGTGDTTVWKIWMFNAARGPIGALYGVGGSPPERRVLTFAGADAPVDYPPLTLYELGAVGRLYRAWSHRRFPNDATLSVFAKLAPLAADVGFAVLLAACVRRRWALVAYWLNPAVILNASVLGYLDAMYVLPTAGAIVAATAGYPFVAGALVAAAMLTKAQAIFVLPAVALPIVFRSPSEADQKTIGRSSNVVRMVVGSATVVVAMTLPVVVAGGLPNMIQAVSRLATHDMVSANACNLWWIVGYLIRANASMHDLGAWTAFTMPTSILGISRIIEIGYPNPRVVGLALTATAFAWALWTARRSRTLGAIAGLAAFLVHAYSTLSAQVHENHLFAAVPLLVLASVEERAFRPIAAGATAVVALNLNLFYGFGTGMGYAIPRGITIIDATVVLAVMNCALFLWHARVLRRVRSRADASRPMPARASRRAPATRTDSSATRT